MLSQIQAGVTSRPGFGGLSTNAGNWIEGGSSAGSALSLPQTFLLEEGVMLADING